MRGGGRRGRWMRRYNALALLHHVKAIHRQVREDFFRSGGPSHLYLICAWMRSQTEMQPQIILRQVAAAAAHFVCLDQVARRHLDASVESQKIPFCPMEFETDPVVLGIRIRTQNHRAALEVLDNDLQMSII